MSSRTASNPSRLATAVVVTRPSNEVESQSKFPTSLRRRVRVLKPARVGDERDVERLRNPRCDLDRELPEDVGEQLTGGRCLRHDEVDVRET